MKIPVYDPQINASTTQYNAVADIRTNTLGEIADGLEQYGKFREAQLEEERKTERFKADAAIRYELQDAKSKMIDTIQNGGSYSDAEAKYQKVHTDTIGKYLPMMGDDPNVTERAKAEYSRLGLSDTIELRNVIQARRKSDVLQSSDLIGKQAEQLFLTDKKKAIEMYSRAITGAQAIGAINGDGGKAKMIDFVQKGTAREMDLVFQNNKDNPQAAADWVEANKADLNPDVYLNGREKAQNEIYAFGSVQQVKNYITDPVAHKAPQQESVDVYYQRELAPMMGQDLGAYEEATINLAVSTGKLPQQLANQAAAYLEMDPSLMSKDDLQTAASNARIVSAANKSAAKLSKTNLSSDTIAKSNLLVQRMDAGMSVDKAMMSMQRDLGTEEGKKLYGSSVTEARNILLEKKLGGERVRVDIPSYAQGDFIQAYATAKMNTAKPSEAARMAQDEINNRYKKFNGITVKDPATSVSMYDEDSWVKASTMKYQEKIGPLLKGQAVVALADGETKRMMQLGERPSFALFLSHDANEPPLPVYDKITGQPIRMYEDPQFMKTIKRKTFSKGSGLKTSRVKDVNLNAN